MMPPDIQLLVDIILLIGGGFGGYIVNGVNKRLDVVDRHLSSLADVYARRDDVTAGFDRIFTQLERMEDKIDRKVNRGERIVHD